MHRLTAAVASRRRAWATLLVAAAAVVAVLLIPATEPAPPDSGSGLPSQFQSVQVERLQAQLPSTGVEAVIAVISRSDGTVLAPAELAAVTERTAIELGGPTAPPEVSPDGTVAALVVPVPTEGGDERVAER